MGSAGLPDNLREIMTQLDLDDLTIFFSALHLPIPGKLSAIDEKSLQIEILVKEFSKFEDPSISELSLYPTEQDLWLPQLIDPDSKMQMSFANTKEYLHYCIDRQIQSTVNEAQTAIA